MPRTDAPLPVPFVIVVDTREQRPWTFLHLRADKDKGCRPLEVSSYIGTLPSGDYSLKGYQHRVAVERKSKEDLFTTVGNGRARFERELARLNALDMAWVIIEADFRECCISPPTYSQLKAKTIHRSLIAWEMRYPKVHWWFAANRTAAEVACFRRLEKWWLIQQAREVKEVACV